MLWYKETQEEKDARRKKWRRVFAWFPVKCTRREPLPSINRWVDLYHCHAWLQYVYKSEEHEPYYDKWKSVYSLTNPDFVTEKGEPVTKMGVDEKGYLNVSKVAKDYGITRNSKKKPVWKV